MTGYKPSGVHIAYQNIAGEIIVVDLQNGFYFSLTETAVFIWEAMVTGMTRERIAAEMALVFDAPSADIERTIDTFINQLTSEQLIVEVPGAIDFDIPNKTTSSAEPKLNFAPATMHKYTDMEDVLSLDPIHDFDEAGWPTQPADVHSK